MSNLSVESLVSEYLRRAEAMFGPMVSDWTYGGVEFNGGPNLAYYPEDGQVVISLSSRARTDDTQLRFQLAHEVCHMLYPLCDIDTQIIERATVLNEGISTWFSVLISHENGAGEEVISNLDTFNQKYFKAFLLVNEMMRMDSDAIKKARVIQPFVNRLDIEDFEDAGIVIPPVLAEQLFQTFE